MSLKKSWKKMCRSGSLDEQQWTWNGYFVATNCSRRERTYEYFQLFSVPLKDEPGEACTLDLCKKCFLMLP